MDSLLTGFCILLTCAVAWMTWRAIKSGDEATEVELRIERLLVKQSSLLPRVGALEAELAGLRLQHQRLHGQFHALKREVSSRTELPLQDRAGDEIAPDPLPPGGVCDNYAIAQREGPTSEAAACQCQYCISCRRIRDELRQKLPKGSHADRVRAIDAAK